MIFGLFARSLICGEYFLATSRILTASLTFSFENGAAAFADDLRIKNPPSFIKISLFI